MSFNTPTEYKPAPATRRQRLGLLLLMAVSASVYLACANSLWVGQHVDDANYVMGAQSLLEGRGYRQIAYPDTPPELKYPPLMSLLIVPWLWLLGGALWATKIPALLCAVAAVPVLFRLLEHFVQGRVLWLLVALVALHPLVVGFAGMSMTEAPSLLLTWLVLGWALRLNDQPPRPGAYFGVGLLLGLGMLLRTDFLALGLAVLLWLLTCRRQVSAALVLAGLLLLFLPWQIHVLRLAPSVPSYQSYSEELQQGWWDPSPLPRRIINGLIKYLGDYIPQTVGLIFGSITEEAAARRGLGSLVYGLKWLLTGLIVAGFIRSIRGSPGLLPLYIILRLGMLIPWPIVTRYLLAMLPFLWLYLLLGLPGRTLTGSRWALSRRAPGLLVVLLLMALGRDALLVCQPPRRHYPDVVAGGALIQRLTPPEAVVMTNWSAKSFYLHSGRRAWEAPSLPEAPLTPKLALQQVPHATHLLLVPHVETMPYDETAFLSTPKLQLLGRNQEGMLLFALPTADP